MTWFTGAGFGLFVHWDHASQQGIEVSWPLIGRSIVIGGDSARDNVSVAQYHSTAATFNPQRWDPAALAVLIIDAPVPTGALIDVIAIEFDGRLD
jgi:alpha-L-fucosidase